MPGRSQLVLPGSQQLLVRVCSEYGIALLKRPLIAAPNGQEFVFHVKHTPVEQPAAPGRPFLDETVDAGIDHLDWKDFCYLGDPRDARAGEIRSSALPAVLDAGNQLTSRGLDPPNDAQEINLWREKLLAQVRPE